MSNLALQSIDKGDYSDDLEDPILGKLATSESLCESMSTSEKRRDSKDGQFLGKGKLKAIEKANLKNQSHHNRGNGQSTPPMKPSKSLGVNKAKVVKPSGKQSVTVGKKQ